MTSAGYSGTPLARKLGMRPAMTVAVHGAPESFDSLLEGLPDDVRFVAPGDGPAGMVVYLTTQLADLAAGFERLTPAIEPAGMFWVAWPKKASKVPTDITENALRDLLLPTGWVDTKVCAIDATWSGLRFVRRKANRQAG
jgi:hypothetical protein